MGRLINAESLGELKYCLDNCLPTEWKRGWNDAIDTIMDMDETPTVDAVPVVRCEDCEFSLMPEWDSDEVYCTKHDNWFKTNGYCHLGRRKERR